MGLEANECRCMGAQAGVHMDVDGIYGSRGEWKSMEHTEVDVHMDVLADE